MGRKTSDCVVAKTIETRRKVKELQKKAVNLAWSSSSRKRREVLDKIGSLLSQRSLTEWPSFLKKTCKCDRVVAENLYSVITFKPLHNLQLGVSKNLKTIFVQ